MESGFQCASCGEWNETSVDESAGRRQSYVEDCQVCCKPNVLRVEYDVSSAEFFITVGIGVNGTGLVLKLTKHSPSRASRVILAYP